MKRIILILAVILSPLTGITRAEDTINCSDYHIWISASQNLINYGYGWTGHQPIEDSHTDSAWITSATDTSLVYQITHAQAGDYINISTLDRGNYLFHVQAGDCHYAYRFVKREKAITKELDIITEDALVIAPHKLLFTIREAGKAEAPHVDSLWIVRKNYYCANPTMCMRVDAQSGDTIDLYPLLGQSENEFQCIAWINGGDYWSNSFSYDGECDDYKNIKVTFTNINPHHLILHISNGEKPAPQVGSLWITSEHGDIPTFMTATGLTDGDTIDLAPLVGMTEKEYLAWMRFGDCVIVYEFAFNGLEFDHCLEADVWRVSIESDYNAPVLRYYLRDYDNQDIENIHVDSVWVTTLTTSPQETPQYICSLQGQPQEDINISVLPKGFYMLYVQTGECVVSMSFQAYNRNANGLTDSQANTPSAVKILHNGQIFILRGEKAYTLTGQETRL